MSFFASDPFVGTKRVAGAPTLAKPHHLVLIRLSVKQFELLLRLSIDHRNVEKLAKLLVAHRGQLRETFRGASVVEQDVVAHTMWNIIQDAGGTPRGAGNRHRTFTY